MTELQQNRYDQLVRRVGNIVAPGSIVGDALNELFPMIDVESVKSELQLLTGTRLGFSSTIQNALAANLNHSQIFNPADSGMLVVLEQIDLLTETQQNIEYALATAGLTNFTANVAFRDTREGILNLPVAQIRDVQQVGGLPQFGLVQGPVGVTITLKDKNGLFVLGPGTGVTFATTLVNTNLQCNYLWRERVAEPAELNFP